MENHFKVTEKNPPDLPQGTSENSSFKRVFSGIYLFKELPDSY